MDKSQENEVVNFPIQRKDWKEPMTDAEMIQDVRLSAIRLLNLKAAGKYEFSFEAIQQVKIVNDICLDLGYPPIVEDISQL
jgi:hypothetical protein